MSTVLNHEVNGRRRPNLSQQIDRLDRMLDGLAEGLNEAVADAVKTAVTTAVRESIQGVLAELLTHPQVVALLHPTAPKRQAPRPPETPPSPPEPPPTLWQRVKDNVQSMRESLANLCTACTKPVRFLGSLASQLWSSLQQRLAALALCGAIMAPASSHILTLAGLGIVIAAAWHTRSWLGTKIVGLGDSAALLGMRLALWLRQVRSGGVSSALKA